jgi:hypothetical protein
LKLNDSKASKEMVINARYVITPSAKSAIATVAMAILVLTVSKIQAGGGDAADAAFDSTSRRGTYAIDFKICQFLGTACTRIVFGMKAVLPQ